MRWLVTASALLVVGAAFLSTRERGDAVAPASLDASAAPLPAGGEITALAVGHEFRQDDSPTIAAAPDGSLWLAWLSFGGDPDHVALRRYHKRKWGALQCDARTSADYWLPQIAVDAP